MSKAEKFKVLIESNKTIPHFHLSSYIYGFLAMAALDTTMSWKEYVELHNIAGIEPPTKRI